MVKLLGGLLVFLGSGLGGIVIANALQERNRELQQFIRGLNLLSAEIGYGMNPLEIAFRRVSQSLNNSVGSFFTMVAERIRPSGSAGIAWREAIKSSRSSMSFSVEDWSVMEEFATSLGLLDKENQIKSVQALISRLEEHLQEATQRVSANDRIYRYSGFAFGLVLVLLLI